MLYQMYQKYTKIPSREWISACPKIELHAHLHGSIRMTTLAQLYQNAVNDDNLKTSEDPQLKIQSILKAHKSFNEVFALFDVIHRVVRSKQVLIRITNEVLQDFANQNVKYLELRSTPRQLEHSNHSREEYVQILLEQIRLFQRENSMQVRLILTMQNAKPLEEAVETLDIIQRYLDNNDVDEEPLIVGIDFAPRCIKGRTFRYYEKVLQRARKMELKITIHFAEYYDRSEQDLVLQFGPDRVGHAVNLAREDYEYLMKHPIPIEMCPTSNILTKSIADYSDHPFKLIRQMFRREYAVKREYPMLFCTDDMGVFEIDLNDEWERMCRAHYLTKMDVRNITMNAVEFIFASEQTKEKLKAELRKEFDI